MEEWKEYNFTEIATIISGGTPKTSNREYWDGDIPWLSVKDFGNDLKYVYTTERQITKLGLDNSPANILSKDDIILSARGTVGELSMIPFPMSFNQSCFGLRAKDIVDAHFLYYLMKTKVRELKNNSHGSVFDTITRATLDNLTCRLPSLNLQKQIARCLSTLDDKIELNRKINDNLEQQTRALYKSWFVDFEPFKDGEFVESEMGEIPVGWTVVKFSDLTEIPKKTINPQKFPDTIFKQYSLPACDNGLIPENQTGKDIMSNKIILQNNTTLFSKLNPRIKRIWFTCEVQPNSICSTEFIPYRATNENESGYIFSIINSEAFYASVMGCVNGATGSHQRFHAEDTEDFLCAYNKDVVKKFSQHINAVLKQMHDLRQENVKLALMRDTLLPKLMSGELKINEIDC